MNPAEKPTNDEALDTPDVAVEVPEMEIEKLKRICGESTYPVATDKFLGRSKEHYSRPTWLSREVAQNFLDHNPGKRRGTLDGVDIETEQLPNNVVRFTIQGPWQFPDPTALVTLHSEKPAEGKSAGGNGIGIKQTALLLLRDFGIQKFEVSGEGWKVNYRLLPGQEYDLRNDWVVGQIEKSENRGICSYIIETNHPEVIEALHEFPNIAVCEQNEYLQDMDFQNEKGSLKWLPAEEEGGELGAGRLFINGQIMDVDDGPKVKGWMGLQGASLSLKDVDYDMSMDRPPVRPYAIGMYASELIESMTPRDFMDQIARSEKIWAGTDEEKRKDVLVIVERIARALSWKFRFPDTEGMRELQSNLREYFIAHQYLARAKGISEDMENDLKEQGYVLCPSFFAELGMPSVSEKIDSAKLAAEQRPDATRARWAREKAAKESGVEIGYEDFGKLSAEKLAALLKERLRQFVKTVSPMKDRIRLELSADIPESLMLRMIITGDSKVNHLVNTIRGIVAAGLSRGIFTQASLIQEDGTFVFGVDQGSHSEGASLLVRKVIQSSSKETLLDIGIADKYMTLFSDFNNKSGSETPEKKVALASEVGGGQYEEEVRPSSQWKKRAAVAGLSLSVLVGGWFAARKSGITSPFESGKPTTAGPLKAGDSVKSPGTFSGGAPVRNAGSSSETDQFNAWTADQYKRSLEQSHYPQGRTLQDIVSEYDQANVPGSGRGIETTGGDRGTEFSDHIEDFEIVREPTEKQLSRLRILRDAFYATTGVSVDNQLFIYRGRGAKGVNIGGRGIGIHEGVIDGNFLEALGVFTHESAHNFSVGSGHGPQFQHAIADLFLETERKMMVALSKAESGEQLSQDDKAVLAFAREWNAQG